MSSLRHIGTRHIHLDATDSTNNRATEYAHDPAYAGIVITADIQAQGRGQHGRVWQSPAGANVLLSTLLFPPPTLLRPAVLTAFAAGVVAETILQATGQQATIKWPNDVLVGGKKVCGILIEGGISPGTAGVSPAHDVARAGRPRSQEEPSRHYFVCGIGLNVNLTADDFEAMGLPDATSLSIIAGQKFDVKAITQSLIRNLDAQYAALLDGGIDALEECWAWRLGKVEKHATVELMDATELHGRVRRIAFDAVELEQANGEVRVLRPEEIRHLR